MMYNLCVALVLLYLGNGHGQEVQDYCHADYCQPEVQNVGCNPPSSAGGPACAGKSAASIDLAMFGKRNIQFILNQHNGLRSQMASGKLPSISQAARMPTLAWDEELARQAGHNARSCVYAHDACRNTKLFRYVGQNIGLVRITDKSIPVDQLIRESIQHWWSEFNVTTQDQLERYPKEQLGSPIGHFTQMVSDRAWKIGCAIQLWSEKEELVFYMVCNYSFSNFEDQPVYRPGPATSRCSTGRNPQFPGLCSTKEQIFSTPNAVTD